MSENELTADGRALCRADRAKARDYVWLDRANAVLAEERKKREAAQGWSDARKCRLKSKQQAWQSAQRLAGALESLLTQAERERDEAREQASAFFTNGSNQLAEIAKERDEARAELANERALRRQAERQHSEALHAAEQAGLLAERLRFSLLTLRTQFADEKMCRPESHETIRVDTFIDEALAPQPATAPRDTSAWHECVAAEVREGTYDRVPEEPQAGRTHAACLSHCCKKHGCKYMHSDCPVEFGDAEGVRCESCRYDEEEPPADAAKPAPALDPAMREPLEGQHIYGCGDWVPVDKVNARIEALVAEIDRLQALANQAEREAEGRNRKVLSLNAALNNCEQHIAAEPARQRAAVVAELRKAGDGLQYSADHGTHGPTEADRMTGLGVTLGLRVAAKKCYKRADALEREGGEGGK